MSTKTIAIASGKGGSGKTTVAVNLASAMGNSGRKVLLFDADVGTANAHIAFRKKINYSLPDALRADISLSDTLVPVAKNVDLISGGTGYSDFVKLDSENIYASIRSFSELEGRYDYLIIDLPAGISELIVEIMKASDLKVIVGNNDPSSVADSYALLKVLRSHQEKMDVLFIPNKVNTMRDGEMLYNKVNALTQKYISLSLSYINGLTHSNDYDLAWVKGQPLCAQQENSKTKSEFESIAKGLNNPVDSTKGGISFFS
tara:strand:- start:143 stop:919 length:777 start_codon:yes stop_codon:yes gene_type:complete